MSRPADSADVTFVTFGGMLPTVEQVADELAAEELSVEIVVPALLNPLPAHQLRRHLLGCDAVVIVEDCFADVRFGSALGAALLESGYHGRFARVADPHMPIPAARSLESRVLPGRSHIVESVLHTLSA